MSAEIISLMSLGSILFLVFVLFWLYPDYRDDRLRQDMFILRDRLFDLALDGRIDFNHPAYGLLRSTMNGAIRYAHRLSLSQFILRLIFLNGNDGSDRTFESRFFDLRESLEPSVRNEVTEIWRKMNLLMVEHVILKSPILLITLVVPTAFYILTMWYLDKLLCLLKKPLNQLDDTFLAIGERKTFLPGK